MKLPIAAYSTENSAAVGAWVLLEPDDAERTGAQSEGAGRTVSWEVQKHRRGKAGSQYQGESVETQRT